MKFIIIHTEARKELDAAILEEVIWIIAIAHNKRKPNYWQQRNSDL